jgi:hypothetical protein
VAAVGVVNTNFVVASTDVTCEVARGITVTFCSGTNDDEIFIVAIFGLSVAAACDVTVVCVNDEALLTTTGRHVVVVLILASNDGDSYVFVCDVFDCITMEVVHLSLLLVDKLFFIGAYAEVVRVIPPVV